MAAGEAHRIAGVLLLAAPLLGLPAHAQMTCDPCKVVVVFDGRGSSMRCCGRASRKEIAALAAPRHTVVFLPDAQRVADWTLDGAQMAVEALLAEPEVDIGVSS